MTEIKQHIDNTNLATQIMHIVREARQTAYRDVNAVLKGLSQRIIGD